MRTGKKAAWNALISILIISAVALFIIIAYFSKGGLLGGLGDDLRKMTGVYEEQDSTNGARNTYLNSQDIAIDSYSNIMSAFDRAAQSEKNICITKFKTFPDALFGTDFKILIKNEGSNGMTGLLQKYVDTEAPGTVGRNVYVTKKIDIQGYSPCTIIGTDSDKKKMTDFYTDFVTNPENIDSSKQYGLEVSSIYFAEKGFVDIKFTDDQATADRKSRP